MDDRYNDLDDLPDGNEENQEEALLQQNRRVQDELSRNLIGFWLLGLCNNFAYVIMLSAAQDILESGHQNKTSDTCEEEIVARKCAEMSTGSVLLADIIPALLIKIFAPLFIQRVPFGLRHFLVVIFQSFSFLLVALGGNVFTALFGVVLASFASGLGEISYLALASNFKNSVISAWSSGTGGAGIFGALTYAILTDPFMLSLSPKSALLSMLVVPVIFAYSYWYILRIPQSVHRVRVFDYRTYTIGYQIGSRHRSGQSESDADTQSSPLLQAVEYRDHDPFNFGQLSGKEKLNAIKPLLPFMLPLMLVYLGEYYINQGMFELIVFDCKHGFGFSPASQYRWYQVLYQFGVFVSRSSSGVILLPANVLPLLAILQLLNAFLFMLDAWLHFSPHILFVFFIIFYEGLLGGGAYVNTFRGVHKVVPLERREFAMGFVSISDTVGIVFAGILAIPAHNFICKLAW
ncbi:unnamed protein product, partial [Mesorhabditis belari]|uniref:Battenin n=1 Tax=Mesorhabditis belari TaxID=2138241 RepID=A0AAF3EG74_9BILA